MVQSNVTAITGDLGAGYPDGMTLNNTVVATALATPGAVETGTTNLDTITLKVYDVDGATYRTFGTGTAGNTPTFAWTQPAGGTLTFDGGAIGSVTPAAGAFTTLAASGLAAFAAAATVGTTLTVTGAATLSAAATVGTTLGVTGAATLSSTLAVTGNISCAAYKLDSTGNALTAAGTTRTDALQLAKQRNIITTAASGTGVILPVGVIGMRITVFNAGANAIQVYASASETIDTVAGATGVPLTNTKRADFFFDAANTWISAQLGVVSA